MKNLCYLFLFVLIFCNSNFAQISNPPLIPEANRVDWTTVVLSVQRPTSYDFIIDVTQPPYNVVPNGNPSTNASGLAAAISAAKNSQGWKVIYFSQPGTYTFNNTIQLGAADKNLVIKGTGSDKVVLFFQTGSSANHCFSITGNAVGNTTLLSGSYSKDNDVLTLTNERTDLNNGDWIELLDHRLDNSGYSWAKAGQVIQIKEKISNTQYKLMDKLSTDYPSNYNPYIQKFDPVQNIGFEDIKVQRSGNDGAANAGRNFNFVHAVNCWLYGVESHGTVSWHVNISASSRIFIHGCFFHHANAYGDPDGTGYGVVANNRSTNCLIENNIFNYLRHAMLVQSSANRNVFAFNYDYDRNYDGGFLPWDWFTSDPILGPADICVHGTYAHTNLFESNVVELIYQDDSHGDNGPYNTFFRNSVYTEGALRNGDVYVANGYNTNIISNFINTSVVKDGVRVSDIFGMFYGNPDNPSEYGLVTHYFITLYPEIYQYTISRDYSYYLTSCPDWISNNYTYPTEGPSYLLQTQLTNSIPARDRKLSEGKYTLNGDPLPTPPLSVSISGPTTGPCATGTWTAHVSGGQYPYSYQWYHTFTSQPPPEAMEGKIGKIPTPDRPIDTWWPVGTNSPTLNYYLCGGNSKLKVDITDNAGTFVSTEYYVIGAGGGGQPLQKNSSDLVGQLNELDNFEQLKIVPEVYSLGQNYPNPFNPSTQIKYAVKQDGFVTVKVYDLLGKVVATLVDENKSAGFYTIDFDASKLSSGTYIYTIKTKDFFDRKKMIVLK